MARNRMGAVYDHPLTGADARGLAMNIELQLIELDSLLRTTKQKV